MKKLAILFLCIALMLTLFSPSLIVSAEPDEDFAVPLVPYYSDESFWGQMGYETLEEFMEWVVEDYYWYDRDVCMPFWQVWLWSGSSKEYFMESYDIDEAEYKLIEDAWQKAWKKAKEERDQRKMQELLELGGTPGIINVMLNGTFIEFTGAVPEIVNGSTFVPVKVFLEPMGAEVRYDAQTREIIAEFEDFSVGFIAGRDTMSVKTYDEEYELPIDVEPYIKKGVSYIPVRSVAQALSLDVYWDRYFNAVVIIDTKVIAEEIDKDFTIINSLFEMQIGAQPTDGTTYKNVLDMLISLKLFDSLDGDKKADASAKISSFSDGKNFSMAGEINLSALVDMLTTAFPILAPDESDFTEILDMLKKIKAELIFNYDEGMLYIKAPILSEFLPELPDNAWLSVGDFDEFSSSSDIGSILEMLGYGDLADGISVGKLITTIFMSNTYSTYYDQVHICEELMSSAEIVKALIGDDRIEIKDGDYTLTLTQEDISEFLYDSSDILSLSIDEFNLKLTIKTDDGVITGVSGDFVIRINMSFLGIAIRIACEFDESPDKMHLSLEVHVKNLLVALIAIDSKREKTNSPVPAAPPEGAVVIPIEEFIDTGEQYWPGFIQQLNLVL